MVLNTRIQDHSKFKFPTFSLCETYIELLHFRLGLLKSESVGISIREARFLELLPFSHIMHSIKAP